VALDGPYGKVKARGNRLVREALGHETRNLQLASAQPGGQSRTSPAGTEREGHRVVDAKARPLCPHPLGVAPKRSPARGTDALQARLHEGREVAADSGSNGGSGSGDLERRGRLAAPEHLRLADQRDR
jgi:hypothetical protein